MLKIEISNGERESTNCIGQLTELFKYDWSVFSSRFRVDFQHRGDEALASCIPLRKMVQQPNLIIGTDAAIWFL